MLTKEEIRKYLQDIEADNVERTIATKKNDKFCQAICAFANDLPGNSSPGYLFIGADDKTGQITGIEVSDILLTTLSGLRDSGQIVPLPTIAVQKVSFPEGDIAVVEVQPSDMPPVRYQGRVWVRIGPRKALASEQDERILSERRLSKVRAFDMQPCAESSKEDIVHSLFNDYRLSAIAPEIIEANERDMFLQMDALGLWSNKYACLTHAGTLLLAESPQNFLPGAYIQFIRLAGDTLESGVVDERKFSGDLQTILRELDAFLSTLLSSRPVQDTILREKQISPYPLKTIRELLMNAIMHRDYQSHAPIRFYWFSDHIEIQNPGGLYGSAAHNFPHMNDYRNPKIAEAMKNLSYVNRFGHGIAAAQHALKENGNLPAEFEKDKSGYFLVRVQETRA